VYLIAQPKALLKKKLESSKADAALIDKKLAALEGKSQDTPTATVLALRAVSQMYRDNIEILKKAIRSTQSSTRKMTMQSASKGLKEAQ
jgi:hypothetical protein